MAIKVAIIGSGPAGFYTAAALLDSGRDVQINVLDRLPTPFGLIRAGVAPDHQTTKNVARKFQEIAMRDEVRYIGNVDVGKDVSIEELQRIYDAVVLAVGAPLDREARIPGAYKKGTFGAASFVGWYNGHPDHRELPVNLNAGAACVIGNGNVALDIARVLVKSDDELARTDMAGYARAAIGKSPITDVYILGRRGPTDAKFSNPELREMGELDEAVPMVKPDQLPDALPDGLDGREARLVQRNLDTLRDFSARGDNKPKRVHFRFFVQPLEILGDDRVEGMRLEKTKVLDGRAIGTGETFEIPCGLVISAIGYKALRLEGVPYDEERGVIANTDGRVSDGLYVVGWAKRGPSGVISSNRPDGQLCANQIIADVVADSDRPGFDGMMALLAERGKRRVSNVEWLEIDAAEKAAAEGSLAPRQKFVTVEDMLSVLDDVGERWKIG